MSISSVVVASSSDPLKLPCRIENKPVPKPKDNEILVRVHASGCCHTDLHAIAPDWPVKPNFPLVPGHEGVGMITARGDKVVDFQVGDRVGVPWLHSSCGSCEFCMEGWETLCPEQTNTGYTVDGCMSEYVLAVAKYAVRIPTKLSNEQAAPIMCAGVTVYKGIKETEARAGQFITIIGAAGGLGHLACQYARAMGLRVIAVDVGAHKKAFCESLGAELAIDISASSQYAQQVVDFTGGGSHAVLDLTAHPAAYRSAFALCRRKGTIVCIGIAGSDLHIPIADLVLRGISVRGSIVGTRQDMREALEFAERGDVCCSVETAPLSEVNEVVARLQRREIEGRVVLEI